METGAVDSQVPGELPQQEPFPEIPTLTPSIETHEAQRNGNKRTRETGDNDCISMRVLENIPAIKSTTQLDFCISFRESNSLCFYVVNILLNFDKYSDVGRACITLVMLVVASVPINRCLRCALLLRDGAVFV